MGMLDLVHTMCDDKYEAIKTKTVSRRAQLWLTTEFSLRATYETFRMRLFYNRIVASNGIVKSQMDFILNLQWHIRP
jgi:hypothetical protein